MLGNLEVVGDLGFQLLDFVYEEGEFEVVVVGFCKIFDLDVIFCNFVELICE